jgi:hypothetical protein
MIAKAIRYFKLLRSLQRVNLALARAAATSTTRQLNPTSPSSWEFCGFSQNGEDGIIDFLTRKIKNPNNYFVEIGCSDGIENNSSWLAIARKFSGLMIDGNPGSIRTLNTFISFLELPLVRCECLLVTLENIGRVERLAQARNPDFFSLDIDGNDYYIAKALLAAGFRPKILAVEYNAAYGPSKKLTIPYRADFERHKACDNGIYFGVSLSGWKELLAPYGYHFVTVDTHGVNAFFIDPKEFEVGFAEALSGSQYRESLYFRTQFRAGWEEQFKSIQHLPFVEI